MQLNEQTIRLIAVGASIAANCLPCLQTNLARAQAAGLDVQALAEAIKVGKMVRQGAASKIDQFVAELNPVTQPATTATQNGCGCEA